MKPTTLIAIVLSAALLSGCATWSPFQRAQSSAEQQSGFTYIPVDPFPVYVATGQTLSEVRSDSLSGRDLLTLLPDNAVRMSVEQFDGSAKGSYGPVGIGAKGGIYRVTVDYINADTTNIRVWIRKSMETYKQELRARDRVYVDIFAKNDGRYTYGSEQYEILGGFEEPDEPGFFEASIPVYIGVGLRVTADIRALEGNVNISGLGAIGAEAEAKRLNGSLVVQTLGINGQSIAAALPIQSELNRTTTQNSIVAVGSIKALLYEEDTIVIPRVVGIYLPFPAEKSLINAIISEISRKPIEWVPPTRL